MLSLMRERWRQDRLPILLYLIAFVVMSYPFVFQMHDSLPMDNMDTHTALWQNWWMRQSLLKGKDLNFSELLFHPAGLDVTLQPRRWSTFPLWTVLYTTVGDPLAFNLVAAFGILFKAYGMYLVGMLLFKERAPAWVAGAFYAFSAPALRLALQQPNTGATEWIPWFMLAFLCGLFRLRKGERSRSVYPAMIAAGICFALNLYMNLKIAVFAMLLGGSYLCFFASVEKLWLSRRLWLGLGAFVVTATVLSAPLLHVVLSSDQLNEALALPAESHLGADIMALLKHDARFPLNFTQSIAALGGTQLYTHASESSLMHVGVVSLAFALAGVAYALRCDRKVMQWVILAVIFLALGLGAEISFAYSPVDIEWTPYRLVQDSFLFQALRYPHRLVLVFLFPYSVLIGYGLAQRLNGVSLNGRGGFLLAVAVGTLLYGTSAIPIPLYPAPRPAYLAALADADPGGVIDLPMGRQASKYYMSVQRFHQRPIVEGMIARMPANSYDYIESNPLLTAFHSKDFWHDFPRFSQQAWRKFMAALEADGFRYLVVHRRVPLSYSRDLKLHFDPEDQLLLSRPIYGDDEVLIFDLSLWAPGNLLIHAGFWSSMPDGGPAIAFGDHFRLHGWSLLDAVDAQPCQTLRVESWWELAEINAGHNTLELVLAEEDGNGQVAISKKAPADLPTSEWQTGIVYRDRAALQIPCSLADGKYPLLLGLVNSETWESHHVRLPDGSSMGKLYYLTTLNVQKR